MLPKIFEGAKVGDEVFSPIGGWMKIESIIPLHDYPIHMRDSEGAGISFMLDGRIELHDPAPICWPSHLVPQYYLDLCPRPRRKVVKTVELWVNIYPDTIVTHKSKSCAVMGMTQDAIATAVHITGTYEVEE